MSGVGIDRWVKWRAQTWPLEPGHGVTFGRAADCDVVLPAEDDLVSREAGTIVVTEDHLEIVNTSGTREFRVRPPLGQDVVVRPGGSTTNRGMPVFAIILTGRFGVEHVLSAQGPAGMPASSRRLPLGVPTQGQPFALNPFEALVVEALCRPMVMGNGASAVPATYQAIAKAVSSTPGYVRKVIRIIRDRLTLEGIPGFDGSALEGAADFRHPLAEYAIQVAWAFRDRDAE